MPKTMKVSGSSLSSGSSHSSVGIVDEVPPPPGKVVFGKSRIPGFLTATGKGDLKKFGLNERSMEDWLRLQAEKVAAQRVTYKQVYFILKRVSPALLKNFLLFTICVLCRACALTVQTLTLSRKPKIFFHYHHHHHRCRRHCTLTYPLCFLYVPSSRSSPTFFSFYSSPDPSTTFDPMTLSLSFCFFPLPPF